MVDASSAPADSGDCAKITDELLRAAAAAAAAVLGNRIGRSRIIEIVPVLSPFSASCHYSLCKRKHSNSSAQRSGKTKKLRNTISKEIELALWLKVNVKFSTDLLLSCCVTLLLRQFFRNSPFLPSATSPFAKFLLLLDRSDVYNTTFATLLHTSM